MHTALQVEESRKKRRIHVGLATSREDIREAQKLRWQIFAEEMGARLDSPEPGLDIDLYDRWCDHLIVRDLDKGEVVGTYRILSPEAAKKIGNFYSDQEFDLTRLGHIRERMVEIGRSCVHPDYRNGGTIALLWSGLAAYMKERGYDYLMGCASITMQDGGHNAAGVWHAIRQQHLAPPEWRVFPRCPLPLEALTSEAAPLVPPLIKGYLRAGAYVCGEPAWDPDFNTADILVLLPMLKVSPAYARHFLADQKA
ncbi:MAG: GNAT family N-acetyltransferase [Thiobacillus sp.]|nr:GNAT family N-acetyltransferase [Thiobacillus sp.]